jgi:hypothetical protein
MGTVELDWGNIVGGLRAEAYRTPAGLLATVGASSRFLTVESEDALLP